MLLAFRDAQLREICAEPDTAVRMYGAVLARTLRTRVAEMRAARVASELLPPIALEPGPPPVLLVPLPSDLMMRWTVNHDPVPLDDQGIDWDSVRRVQLRCIEERA